MQLSMRTDYALRALFALVGEPPGQPVPISVLAARHDIPKRFLEQILLEMKALGWVRSLPGKKGGYLLAIAPSALTMGRVVRHFDGHLAPIHCVSVSGYRPCSQEAVCRFRRVLLEARNTVTRLMDSATLEDVFRGKPVSLEEVMAGLDGEGI